MINDFRHDAITSHFKFIFSDTFSDQIKNWRKSIPGTIHVDPVQHIDFEFGKCRKYKLPISLILPSKESDSRDHQALEHSKSD